MCIPATAINPLVVTVQFDLDTDSNWTHLAEVTFYDDSTTCPPDTIITTTATTIMVVSEYAMTTQFHQVDSQEEQATTASITSTDPTSKQ